MKYSVLIFLLLNISNVLICQKTVSIVDNIYITEKENIQSGYIQKLIPKSINAKQSVIDIEYSIQPDIIYELDGNKFAKWHLTKLNSGDLIQITSTLILNRFDLTIAKKKIKEDNANESLDQFLKHKSNLQKNNKKIKAQAQKLIGINEEETVNKTFDFVVNHMKYHEFPNEKRSAKKALKKRLGDCTEYSELMIALCRANNIPSRIVFGRVLNKNGVVELHNWAEVYIKNIGWVPFDPTLADKKNSLSKFSKLENIYVYLSNDRKGRETEWTFYSEGKGNVELDHKQYWE
jgi:hypothetical protein